MLDKLTQIIQKTINTGIGQSIIAFGAWDYVIVLIIIIMYYSLLCLIRSIMRSKD